jgi:hypothetical protein
MSPIILFFYFCFNYRISSVNNAYFKPLIHALIVDYGGVNRYQARQEGDLVKFFKKIFRE